MRTYETIEFTPIGKSYWAGCGSYNAELQKYMDELVPSSGPADSVEGELVRGLARLNYDYGNNGNCNVVQQEWETEEYSCSSCGGSGECDTYEEEDEPEDCDACGGSGYEEEEVEGEITIGDYYQKFIDLILKTVPDISPEISNLTDLYDRVGSSPTFEDAETNIFDRLIDKVTFFLLQRPEDAELTPLPEDYPEKNVEPAPFR
ncbi:hypothetical protein Molly5_9 [Maribacter phage Molly_5]|nr:hypothetical protein Molly4_9 [Maribacter phage Molly_4]QQO98377.1 hypothetical protein Molly5_9 [Maribacter phage Molly_5]